MGNQFLELFFGYWVKVKVKSEVINVSAYDSPTTHYTGHSKLNPSLLQKKAQSPKEKQLQSAAARFRQSKTPTGYHKATKTICKPVEWAGFNAQQDRLVAGSGNNPKRLTGGVRTDDRLAACPP